MAPPKSDFDKEMQHLEAEMRRLEAEYNMFFAGRLPRLPWETRARVEALVKKHDRSFIRNTADRFRFETLQNKFAKFGELWERQLTQMEGGRPKRGGAKPPAAPARTAGKTAKEEPAPPAAVADRVVRFSSAGADEDRVKELYEKLAEVKRAAGEAAVPMERVAALVRAQVQKFAADGSEVAFRVAMKDGKVSLTVKPVKAGED
ncbi:MAG: MXAN_5187 C-terminal domain-containing protein [Vicinamibacterales bacterium]